MPAHPLPKLHNAMWPGLVGKGTDAGQEPPISLERMLQLTAAAEVDGQRFDGIDYFLFLPHTNPEASDAELRAIADKIASYGFTVGSLVAPVWPGTVGDSAMGDAAAREKFLSAVKMACRIAQVFERHDVVGAAVNLNVVAINIHDQLTKLILASKHRRLPNVTFV